MILLWFSGSTAPASKTDCLRPEEAKGWALYITQSQAMSFSKNLRQLDFLPWGEFRYKMEISSSENGNVSTPYGAV